MLLIILFDYIYLNDNVAIDCDITIKKHVEIDTDECSPEEVSKKVIKYISKRLKN